MFDRLDPWGFLWAFLGCPARSSSDLILLAIGFWVAGFLCGAFCVLLITSPSARSIGWLALGWWCVNCSPKPLLLEAVWPGTAPCMSAGTDQDEILNLTERLGNLTINVTLISHSVHGLLRCGPFLLPAES